MSGGTGPGGGTTPGITNLMGGRSTYLLAQSEFTATEPAISNVTVSNTSPTINSTLTITATLSNENAVYLGYRTDVEDQFSRITMYDDGAHNDGAANDGVYGVDVLMSNIFMQYYIYAENNNIGKFSPVRAEHEFHTINIVTPPVGDVVINELLASNSANTADQDGEYDDWIELYNNTSASINLGGYYLSDNIDNLMKWQIPSGTSINANGYLIVWADEDTTQTGLHANFKLASSGETLFLVNATGTIIDQIFFPSQTTDITYGRFANGTGNFQQLWPTFNAQNLLNTATTNIAKKEVGFRALPNPAHDYIKLEMLQTNTEVKNVAVYDLLGRNIFSSTMKQNLTINTSNWTPALYIIKVGNGSIKVMVQ